MIVCLIGRSGSGKSTMADKLAKKGYTKLKSWTSRPPRKGDSLRDEYIFSTKEEMQERFSNGFFLEMKEYQGNLYGTEKIDINSNEVYVKAIEKQGYLELLDKMNILGGHKVISIYLEITKEESLKRCSNRQGGLTDSVIDRVNKDDTIYNTNDLKYDHIVNAELSKDKVLDEIVKIINSYKGE